MRPTKPTPAAIRRRLEKIERLAIEARELAERWNPKGKYFVAQRDVLQIAGVIKAGASSALSKLPARRPSAANERRIGERLQRRLAAREGATFR